MYQKIVAVVLAVTSFFLGIKYNIKKPADLTDGGIRVHYAEAQCNYMDIYLPQKIGEKQDVVLAVHGGAWMSGDQTMFTKYAKKAAKLGYVGVTVDYSKTLNKATAQTMVDEIHTAIGVLKEVLAARGIRPDKLLLFSHSAGSHLALLYAYTHHADCPIPIGFLAALSSPADLRLEKDGKTSIEKWRSTLLTCLTGENITDRTIDTTEGRAAVAAINPIDHVTPDVPPTLLAHGNADNVVPYENSVNLKEKLLANGVPCELLTFEGQPHFLSRAPQKMQDELLEKMLEWAKRYM